MPRGSGIRIDTSSDHFCAECPPNARSTTSHAVLRLLQSIRGVVPHIVHIKSQTIDGLLEQQVLGLLVIERAVRLLSQLKIGSELANPLLESLLLLVGLFRLNGV